jgi:hypothetical protein
MQLIEGKIWLAQLKRIAKRRACREEYNLARDLSRHSGNTNLSLRHAVRYPDGMF